MKRYLLIILIFNVLNGQSKPFDSFNVIIYPEYYFEGIMAELEAEIKESDLPLNLKMTVPVNADSIFFVSGDNPNEPDVKILSIINVGNFFMIWRSIYVLNILSLKHILSEISYLSYQVPAPYREVFENAPLRACICARIT